MVAGWSLAGVALLAGGVAAGVARAEPSSLCGRAEVLQEVAREVRQWNAYNTIDPYSVREAPTERANAVVCHATMRSRGYRHYPDGWRPVSTEERRRFDVQVDGNRFQVQVPR